MCVCAVVASSSSITANSTIHRRIDRAHRRILYVQSLFEQCRIWLYVHRRLLYVQSLYV